MAFSRDDLTMNKIDCGQILSVTDAFPHGLSLKGQPMFLLRMTGMLTLVAILTTNHCLAQGLNNSIDRLETAVHLVGHEDDELLSRVKDLIDDWDPRKFENPYVETVTFQPRGSSEIIKKKVLRRKDLNQFIADVDAAEALGKAFFWDMQAGSDFRKTGNNSYIGTACASCHYRFGADARNRSTTRIPYVVWDKVDLADCNGPKEFGWKQQPFDPKAEATHEFNGHGEQPLSLIVGSQGVEPYVFQEVKSASEPPFANGYWEKWTKRSVDEFKKFKPEWSIAIEGHQNSGQYFRQITTRNSPSVINSGFADRLFHDGRAESTFNGFSIFGDYDHREILYRSENGTAVPTRIAIPDAALASQAVGPIVNDIEMSYVGRTFHHVACKLLKAEILARQTISDTDSVLSPFVKDGDRPTYEELIKQAFRSEWWDSADLVELKQTFNCEDDPDYAKGSIMHANFPLYWGLSVMLYEASLVSNDSPFDQMMQGNGEPVNKLWDQIKSPDFVPIRLDRTITTIEQPELKHGTEVFQRGFRVFMNRCIECHDGPFFSQVYERDRFEDKTLPIAHTMNNILFPYAQSESIALKKDAQHQVVLERIADEISGVVTPRDRALRTAWEKDSLRQFASGSQNDLFKLIKHRLSKLGIADKELNKCAEELVSFERDYVHHIGGRAFFNETARVAAAELLVEPVLVEKMLHPQNLQKFRLPLPYFSILDKSYSFYDLGFYNLGVAPPRFDRGNGHHGGEPDIAPDEFVELLASIAEENPTVTLNKTSQDIREAYQKDGNLESIYNDQQLQVLKQEFGKQLGASIPAQVRQAIDGVPGQAYRFRKSYSRPPALDRYYNQQKFDQLKNDNLPQPENVDPNATSPCVASKCNPDADLYEADFVDTSANRDDLVGRRRADRHFLSRARRLVMDEYPWGHRRPLTHDNELSFWGAFKTPTLRNVSLTGPYMHNGRLMSLFDVVDFYAEGGDVPFDREHNPDKHPEMVPFNKDGDGDEVEDEENLLKEKFTAEDRRALVFFMHCLTDPRVQYERAPFDHPSLNLVNGYEDQGGNLIDHLIDVDELGASGSKTIPKTFPADK